MLKKQLIISIEMTSSTKIKCMTTHSKQHGAFKFYHYDKLTLLNPDYVLGFRDESSKSNKIKSFTDFSTPSTRGRYG